MNLSNLLLITIASFTSLYAKSQTSRLDSIINASEAKKLVEYLASDSMKGRLTGSKEMTDAARFIASEFEKSGTKSFAGLNGYLVPFQFSKNDQSFLGLNVIAALQGKTKPNEVIMFSAHYDHIGTGSANGDLFRVPPEHTDSIYNGANDDASGVAAVILLARYFALLDNNERTLVFCTFSGEELGLYGSKALSAQVQADHIKAVINIEMIGRNRERGVHPYITGAYLSNLQTLLNDNLATVDVKKYGKHYFTPDPYSEDQLFARSDNYTFATLGIPAHSIMLASPNDSYYHTVHDEVKTLDFETMTQVIRAIALSAEPLARESAAIKRIRSIY
jgi:Zn-dependent M28 family amino/carboxypeptidase